MTLDVAQGTDLVVLETGPGVVGLASGLAFVLASGLASVQVVGQASALASVLTAGLAFVHQDAVIFAAEVVGHQQDAVVLGHGAP